MVDKIYHLNYLRPKKYILHLAGAPHGANRETGEIPVRTRRCDRGRNPLIATGLSLTDWEGGGD